MIRDEKLQYGVNREVAKISALSPGKIDKYEYLTSKEILPPAQRRNKQKQLKIKVKNKQTNIMNLSEKILISTEMAYHLKNKKKYLMNLIKKGLLNLGM